ncbi:MAG: NUDIX hydrolase [Planctomycetota bacterium]|nr:NUDIX hydrolase [Planctomycetota bacterium]
MKDRWRKTGSEVVYDARVFRVRRDSYEFGGAPTHDFHVIEAGTWVNVVAVTPDGAVVLVRQFRHGIEEVSLEVPGGLVDGTDADPAAGARRELLEETGYAGGPLRRIGSVTSNPAILNNRTESYLTQDAVPTADPAPDPNEELELVLVPKHEITGLVLRGEIHHSLSVCALAAWLLEGA